MRLYLAAFLCVLPLLAACDWNGDDVEPPTIENTTFAPALGIDLAAFTRSTTGLYYRDLVVGTGDTVSVGDTVAVHYTGWFSDGVIFDQNVPGPGRAPLEFLVGVGRRLIPGTRGVIPGFDEGVDGMRLGGRRQLIIPPELGYRDVIRVFTVEPVDVY